MSALGGRHRQRGTLLLVGYRAFFREVGAQPGRLCRMLYVRFLTPDHAKRTSQMGRWRVDAKPCSMPLTCRSKRTARKSTSGGSVSATGRVANACRAVAA
jgi:hypothetical protein